MEKFYFFYGGIRSSSPAATMMSSRLTNINTSTTLLANQPQHRPFWSSFQTTASYGGDKTAQKTINYGPLLIEIGFGAVPTIEIRKKPPPQPTKTTIATTKNSMSPSPINVNEATMTEQQQKRRKNHTDRHEQMAASPQA